MYYWDDVLKRYRDEQGRFVSRQTVLDFVDRSISGTTQVSELLADLVANGQLSPTDWYNIFREELKREYIRQYLLGHGGLDTMTFSDWGRIGAMLKEQYQYLKNFAAEIASGNLSAAQIAARSQMYFNSSREAFETANSINAIAWGAVEERWQVSFVVENCPDCLGYYDEGWKPIGYFPMPGDGSTVCLCLVSPENRILTDHGWIPLLDIKVGDFVYTHKSRYCRVNALVLKRSLPTHKLEKIGDVWCTDTHLFNTIYGWSCAAHIKSKDIDLYRDNQVEIPEVRVNNLHFYYFGSVDVPDQYIRNDDGISFGDFVRLDIIRREKAMRTSILVGDVLFEDTAVFDIEVEEDHSFCVEGIFAHNTNCHCWKDFRNAKGELYYAS